MRKALLLFSDSLHRLHYVQSHFPTARVVHGPAPDYKLTHYAAFHEAQDFIDAARQRLFEKTSDGEIVVTTDDLDFVDALMSIDGVPQSVSILDRRENQK